MATQLQTFTKAFGGNSELQVTLDALIVDDEPWFPGASVALILGYANPRTAIRTHVREKDKTELQNLKGHENCLILQGNQGASVYISESGLYSLIMKSRLPHVQPFQDWVTSEVLPSIRKTGSYVSRAQFQELQDHLQHVQRQLLDAQAEHRDTADLVDAAEFLRRKGHSPEIVRRLAPELGKAFKAAWLEEQPPATRGRDYGAATRAVTMYRAFDDAPFLEAVYQLFQRRELYKRLCSEHEAITETMEQRVAERLSNARGFKQPPHRGEKRQL